MTESYIGIDLGTTFSAVAYYNEKLGKPEIINDESDISTVASQVAFTEEGVVVGNRARTQQVINPRNTIYDIKRMIGVDYSSPTLQIDIAKFPFEVAEKDGKPVVVVDSKEYTPEYISGLILKHLKENAERKLGHECKNAIVTVPANFRSNQREATKVAAEIAGFKKVQILNEPSAAALCSGLYSSCEEDRIIFIFDFGGGTLDTSVLKVSHDEIGEPTFDVLAVSGNIHLGGEDLDNAILEHMLEIIKEEGGPDLLNIVDDKSRRARALLKQYCEEAKITLSSILSANITIEKLYGDYDFNHKIKRAEFERYAENILDKLDEPIDKALEYAGVGIDEIDDVILIGGSSKIPFVKEFLTDKFGKEPYANVNQDQAVALGAAFRGHTLTEKKVPRRKPRSKKESEIEPVPIPSPKKDSEIEPVPIPSSKKESEIEPAPIPSSKKDTEIEPAPIPSSKKDTEIEPVPIPSPKKDSEIEPAPIPSSKKESEIEPAPIPSSKKDTEIEPAPIPSSKKESEIEPAPIPSSKKDSEIEPAPIPSSKKESEIKPAPIPDSDSDYYDYSDSDADRYEIDTVTKLKPKYIEKTSFSIGVSSKGRMNVFIPKNTKLPFQKLKQITTTKDYQTSASIVLYEGEEPVAKDNPKIGKFVVENLPKMKAYEVRIDLRIGINTEGIISCKATVQGSDMAPVEYTVNSDQNKYTKEEIERLKMDAIMMSTRE